MSKNIQHIEFILLLFNVWYAGNDNEIEMNVHIQYKMTPYSEFEHVKQKKIFSVFILNSV